MAESAVATELEGWSPRNTSHGVTAWIRYTADGVEASDRGFTLGQLHAPSAGLRLAIRGLCRTNDVRIDRGALVVTVAAGGDVAEAIDRLARTSARVRRLAA